MLNILRSSIQNELDNFFKIITGSDVPVHSITKGAFTKARKKLKYQAFVELNDKKLYRVRIGPELDKNRAEKTKARLEKINNIKTILVSE